MKKALLSYGAVLVVDDAFGPSIHSIAAMMDEGTSHQAATTDRIGNVGSKGYSAAYKTPGIRP